MTIVPKDSEQSLKFVSQVTDYAILSLDQKGHVISWNAGAERILLYKPEEITGKHFSIFHPRSEIDNLDLELRIAKYEGRYEREGWRVRKDGTMFWASVVVTTIRDNNTTECLGFAVIIRDLTSRKQAEEALRQNHDRYRLLVESIADYAIAYLDSEGRIISWNSAANKITGYSATDILGSHFSTLYKKEDLAGSKYEILLNYTREIGRYEEKGIHVRKDGTTYRVNVILTAVNNEFGNLTGYSVIFRDVTEKEKVNDLLRDSDERFRLMVAGVQEYAIFMLDPKGNVTTWNLGAERTMGYTANEIIGNHFSIFYPEEDKKSGKPAWILRRALEHGCLEDENWRIRKDGTAFWANVAITPIYDIEKNLIGFTKVTRNLTERKRAELVLKESNLDLELRVKERTKELTAEKIRAEQAVKARDQFFSMASHELRTPVSSLLLQVQLRHRLLEKEKLSEFTPEKLKVIFKDDERQILRLNQLIERIFDISRLSIGTFELSFKNFDLTETIQEIVKRLEPILAQTRNEIIFSASKRIKGCWDQLRIEQVISNLLTNAGKYAPGKPVTVSLEANEKWATIKISDEGPGIAKADQERLFEAFERLNQKNAPVGLGLGLYISKKIIEAHNGRIHVESELGKNCTFIIELPIQSNTDPMPDVSNLRSQN